MTFGPVRFSHLRAYGRSPMHGLLARTKGGEATGAMQLGTAVHALLFGTRQVCGYPGAQRRGKDYDAFAAEHYDYEILTMQEYDKAQRMADAVRSSELAMSVLAGTAEQTLLFRWMGMDCRATPDVRAQDYITELKTSNSSDPLRFTWHAIRMHYHAQMQYQSIACQSADSRWNGRRYIVCVESAEPFPVTVFELGDNALDHGQKLLTLWMERLRGSEQSKEWPGYAQNIVPLDLPDEDAEPLEFGDDDELGGQA